MQKIHPVDFHPLLIVKNGEQKIISLFEFPKEIIIAHRRDLLCDLGSCVEASISILAAQKEHFLLVKPTRG